MTVTLSSSSPSGAFSTTTDGPWTSALDVSVAAGTSSASAYYRDTTAGTPTITATSAGRQPGTQQETVSAAALASLVLTPAAATLSVGAPQTFTAAGTDAYGNAVVPAVTWSLSPNTPGTLSSQTATTTTFTGTAAGSGTVVATSGTVTAGAAVTVTSPALKVSSIAYTRSNGKLTTTISVVSSTGQGVSGVTVALRIYRGSSIYTSGTWKTSTGGKLSITTSSKASSGCYKTTLTSVTLQGYAWDGVTPSNGICF